MVSYTILTLKRFSRNLLRLSFIFKFIFFLKNEISKIYLNINFNIKYLFIILILINNMSHEIESKQYLFLVHLPYTVCSCLYVGCQKKKETFGGKKRTDRYLLLIVTHVRYVRILLQWWFQTGSLGCAPATTLAPIKWEKDYNEISNYI